VEFAILILQTELLLVKKSLRIIERMEVEVQHELNTAALKIQEADLQKAIKRLQEVECQKPPTNCASPKPAPEIVESETICHYCVKGKIYSRKTDCCKCAGYNNFVGRRLQA
jgi:hypothetical protein